MVYPIVTPVPWALGRYDSYTLYPNGTLVGTIHPPGLVFKQIDNQHFSDMDNLLSDLGLFVPPFHVHTNICQTMETFSVNSFC